MPLASFFLDAEGYERCVDLIEGAGMRFIVRQRANHEADLKFGLSAFTEAVGSLVSPHGTFSCGLRTSEGKYWFFVTGHGDKQPILRAFADVENALAKHLLGKHEVVA